MSKQVDRFWSVPFAHTSAESLEAKRLREKAQALVGEALAVTPTAKYKKVWMDLFLFMENVLGVKHSFPVQADVVAMFCLHVHEGGWAVVTLRQKLSAISYLHNLYRLEDPCKDVKVSLVLKALVKDEVPCESKNPITIGLLECIMEVVHLAVDGLFEMHLFRAIVSIMYHVCLRIGECVLSNPRQDHSMAWDQICFIKNHSTNEVASCNVSFKNFKHPLRWGRQVIDIAHLTAFSSTVKSTLHTAVPYSYMNLVSK